MYNRIKTWKDYQKEERAYNRKMWTVSIALGLMGGLGLAGLVLGF